MRASIAAVLGILWTCVDTAQAQIQILKRSDVVFMYQASRQTYEDYGATFLAWGGEPTPQSLAEARGLRFFGSVGMVTEFGRYYERFPQTYEQGLCRDIEGKPYKVPWLVDLQHKGVPFWWCCTRQPLFRQYLSERVAATVKAGANGVHIDDHLGTAGGLWQGGCFCDRCVEEFPAYLKSLPPEELGRLGVKDAGSFNCRNMLRAWVAEKAGRTVQQHPLWNHLCVYQLRGAASFMAELRALAAKTAGRPVPMGANAGLLWPHHLNDYQSLDLFSAEILHHAETRRFSDDPLVAYRLADAVGRPLAATASGEDWAFIKERNLPGLVQGWIVMGYAAGHCLMAPHRQWCHTAEKGTHWYEGPKEKFAPLYRFVRQNAFLFDEFQNHADLTVALSHRTFDRDSRKLTSPCQRLSAANISYRLALGSDEVVGHPLPAAELASAAYLLVLEPRDFTPADQRTLTAVDPSKRLKDLDAAIAKVMPAVRCESPGPLRILPRVKPGAAVVHLVNRDYDAGSDGVRPLKNVRLRADLAALGVTGAAEARWFAPDTQPRILPITQDALTIPEMGLWSVLEITRK
ncbi:MAG: hypothetical protein KA354_17040 [Phycisphaerae bacterium]|nr:hypothetical protein [Phycisphaerae bacterium]